MSKEEVDGYKMYYYECPECGKDDQDPLGQDDLSPVDSSHEKYTAEVTCEDCGCEFIVAFKSL